MPQTKVCPGCQGSKVQWVIVEKPCYYCNGTWQMGPTMPCMFYQGTRKTMPCMFCRGTRKVSATYPRPCAYCDGRGYVWI